LFFAKQGKNGTSDGSGIKVRTQRKGTRTLVTPQREKARRSNFGFPPESTRRRKGKGTSFGHQRKGGRKALPGKPGRKSGYSLEKEQVGV